MYIAFLGTRARQPGCHAPQRSRFDQGSYSVVAVYPQKGHRHEDGATFFAKRLSTRIIRPPPLPAIPLCAFLRVHNIWQSSSRDALVCSHKGGCVQVVARTITCCTYGGDLRAFPKLVREGWRCSAVAAVLSNGVFPVLRCCSTGVFGETTLLELAETFSRCPGLVEAPAHSCIPILFEIEWVKMSQGTKKRACPK